MHMNTQSKLLALSAAIGLLALQQVNAGVTGALVVIVLPPVFSLLADGLLALMLAGFLNLIVLYQIRSRSKGRDASFLVRVYVWTILLRYSIAIVLNTL